MVAQYVNELPENVQVLLAMRSAFQVWFDNSRYLQSISAEGLKQDGVE
jgi:membrane protease subunit (stomatin/prohibitin family)